MVPLIIRKFVSILRKVFCLARWVLWKCHLGSLGKRVFFYKGVTIHSPENVQVGDDCIIGDYVQIWGGGGVSIGNNTLIAAHSILTSESHEKKENVLYKDTHVKAAIVIGHNVWIGASSVVLPGVNVGDNAVVGAGAVVTKSVPKGCTVVGVPAKVVSSGKREEPRKVLDG